MLTKSTTNAPAIAPNKPQAVLGANIRKSSIKTYENVCSKFKSFASNQQTGQTNEALFSAYFETLKQNKLSTIKKEIAALKYYCKEFDIQVKDGFFTDCVKRLGNNIEHGQTTVKKAKPCKREIILEHLNEMDARQKAIVCLSFWGAFRVSELVNIKLSDIEFTGKTTFTIALNKSKNLKLGATFKKLFVSKDGSKLCPVSALTDYIREYQPDANGFLFYPVSKAKKAKGTQLTRLGVKKIMDKIGLTDYSTHSFRRAFVIEALKAGASVAEIAQQTGQTELTILQYSRDEKSLQNNAISKM